MRAMMKRNVNDALDSLRRALSHRVFGFGLRVGAIGVSAWLGGSFLYSVLKRNQEQRPIAQRWLPRRTKITLVECTPDPHDPQTCVFRFSLPNPSDFTGHAVVSSVLLEAQSGARRLYTPISPPDQRGYVDFAVKQKPGGAFTLSLFGMKVGESIHMRNWKKEYQYRPHQCDTIGYVSGGIGITPALQILNEMFRDDSDRTRMELLLASEVFGQTPFFEKLRQIEREHPDRLRLHYNILRTSKNYAETIQKLGLPPERCHTGRIVEEHIRACMPPPSENGKLISHVMVCGPKDLLQPLMGDVRMTSFAPSCYWQAKYRGILRNLGYVKRDVYKFGRSVRNWNADSKF